MSTALNSDADFGKTVNALVVRSAVKRNPVLSLDECHLDNLFKIEPS